MRTDLYDHHIALGGKMVNFSGWLMPLQYKGIIHEHQSVRQQAGIFDVSHMGRILIEGPEAEACLDWLSTNTISGKEEGSATYTVWCREDGSCVDDLIVYKKDANHFFVIVNAGNRDKDLQHLINEAGRFDVRITPRYEEDGIIAIQGPEAIAHVSELFPQVKTLKPFHFIAVPYQNHEVIIALTGYTGAGGCEICGPKEVIRKLWEHFINKGVAPIGLGARDTLRLEMGYALYGHELSDTIAPNETVSAWTIKRDKLHFLGKQALERYHRREYGIVLTGKGIAREGYPVYQKENKIGVVTSGTMSPTLGKAIGIILTEKKLEFGEAVDIMIRDNRVAAEIVKLPFLKVEELKK